MTHAAAGPRPGFLDGPLRLYIDGESTSIWPDLEAAVPQSGQGISR